MEQQNTQTEEVEQGDHINRDNVAGWDVEPTNERYTTLNTAARTSHTGQKGFLLKDRETGAIHVTTLNSNLSQPNYYVSAADISLKINGTDVTTPIINDLARNVQYNHRITGRTVEIEYQDGESGWPEEDGNDNWDVRACVTTDP